MKIAILGASGIGKNHARWFRGHGCEVKSFLGSSQENIAKTQEMLHETLGVAVRGFDDLSVLLRESRPDIVCISNPPRFHFEHAKQCLQAGAHVLCEKPLVGDDVQVGACDWREIVAQADELVRLAAEKKCLLGTQMQYAHAAPLLCELTQLGEKPVREWSMELETKNVRPGRGGAQIWIDLSPHPLSVLQKLRGAIEIDWNSASCRIEEMKSEARFSVRIAGQDELCAARIVVRCNPQRAVPRRRIVINGRAVDYVSHKNEAGDFKAFFSAGAHTLEKPDLVDMLIGNFVRACAGKEALLVTGEDGARNVEMQLRLMQHS